MNTLTKQLLSGARTFIVSSSFLISFGHSLLAVAQSSAEPNAITTEFSGHAKYQFIDSYFPDDSFYRTQTGASKIDHNLEFRFKLAVYKGPWSIQADYQLIHQYSRSGLFTQNEDNALSSNHSLNDRERLLDLSDSLSIRDTSTTQHRLDRLHVSYTGEKTVFRIGRQVLSWGNGMIFNPMDIFNPFDPASIDTEYKGGDDMIYGQYLLESGDDIQTVWVFRRDPNTEKPNAEQRSLAVKYHGFAGLLEYDILLAEHYDERLWGIGLSQDVGGALWRADATLTNNKDTGDTTNTFVTNLSYSWVAWNKNISAVGEYFYNGFGTSSSPYSLQGTIDNTSLKKRLDRGELYTLGRHYLGLSATMELTPLFWLTGQLQRNLDDRSTLLQLITQYDLEQNLQLTSAVNLPFGHTGSEYGGIDSGIENLPLSAGPSLFVQLAWYF